MIPPVLAPRPRDPVTSIQREPQPALMYTESEWVAKYPEIERLYVRERRKLRYVMQQMERKYGFKATEQMYKKRFAKWGFQKSIKRSTTTVQTKSASRIPSSRRELGSMPPSPKLTHDDGLMLVLLTSVRTWSVAFFESLQSSNGFLESQLWRPPTDQIRTDRTIEINFAFKSVSDLLDRGHGVLAGRMARKAFLLVEDMLTLEGPALAWNLLEMMHNMVKLRHMQLFQMLLAHLIALTNSRMPDAHPLSTILRSLWGLMLNLKSASTNHSGPSLSPSSSSRSSSTEANRTTADNYWLLSPILPCLLEQAWMFNAKIIFDHFEPGLMQLYCRIFWDACSIDLPAPMIGVAVQWLRQMEARQISSAAAEAYLADEGFGNDPFEEQKMLPCLIAPRIGGLPPQDYAMLHESSLAALREHGDLILSEGAGFNCNTTTLLGNLAALVTAKIIEDCEAIMESSDTSRELSMAAPRIYAGHVACAIRAVMDLNVESSGGVPGVLPDNVERLRAIMTLREYCQGEISPQVVREMWLLEDALITAGEYEEAQQVGRDAYRRLEKYVRDVPAGCA